MSSADVSSLGCILYPTLSEINSCMNLCKIVKKYGERSNICYIWHDPEPTPENEREKKKHLHVLINYRSGHISRDAFMREFNISGYCCEQIKDRDGFIRYLVHRTKASQHKIQYEDSLLHHNFPISHILNKTNSENISEAEMVLDVVKWAVRNNASYLQVFSYVSKKGYNWTKFRQNSNIIFKAIEQEKFSPSKMVEII